MSTRRSENHRQWKQTPGRCMMKSLRDHESVRPSGSTGMDGEHGEDRSGVVGNERLTALAGAVLLVLIGVELVTVANLRAGLSFHVSSRTTGAHHPAGVCKRHAGSGSA